MQSIIDRISTAENVLRTAEAVSVEVIRTTEQIMERTQGEKGMSTRVNERLYELMKLTVSERIDAVAADLEQQVPRYGEISAHDLAQALDVPDPTKPGTDWSFVRYASIISVEEYAEHSFPPSDIVYLIKDHVPTSRFEQLLALCSELDDVPKPQFDFLTATERSRLEHAMAEQEMENNASNGMNCLAHFSVEISSGGTLAFEAVVEDDGSCIELRTPMMPRRDDSPI